jgi:hypothetical protein
MRRAGAALVLALVAAATEVGAACTDVDHAHTAWTAVLREHVRDGRVDYAALARDDRPLNAYLAALSGTCATDYERWTRAQRIAFWLNAYNAFTVRLIVNHYPIASIRRIGWLPGAAFRERFIPMPGLKGGTISLDDIEHGTLRSAFREPRIHFALVCAARSCPALRGEAYRAADLDRQLEDQGRVFLHDPTKNRVDVAAKMLYLSSIFDWFRDDFVAAAGSVPAFVMPYLDDVGIPVTGFALQFLDYDWSLNDREGDLR